MQPQSSTRRHICHLCGGPIAAARVAALPGVTVCLHCAKTHPVKKVQARQLDLSQASPINRNGFAPSD